MAKKRNIKVYIILATIGMVYIYNLSVPVQKSAQKCSQKIAWQCQIADTDKEKELNFSLSEKQYKKSTLPRVPYGSFPPPEPGLRYK